METLRRTACALLKLRIAIRSRPAHRWNSTDRSLRFGPRAAPMARWQSFDEKTQAGMRRIAFLLLAAISLLSAAGGETRPRYGGTVRVMLQATPNALEIITNGTPAEYWASARIVTLIADPLVKIDVAGRAQPCLATSLQRELKGKRRQ